MTKSKDMAHAYLHSESNKVLNGDGSVAAIDRDQANYPGDLDLPPQVDRGNVVEAGVEVIDRPPAVNAIEEEAYLQLPNALGDAAEIIPADEPQLLQAGQAIEEEAYQQLPNALGVAAEIIPAEEPQLLQVGEVAIHDGQPEIRRNNRLTFKDLDGIRKLADLPLPGLLQLPTGSCEAMLLRVSRNNGFGYVPINEYIRDRQTILDKGGNNGIFLNSHDGEMKALVYKTTVCVPEMPRLNMF